MTENQRRWNKKLREKIKEIQEGHRKQVHHLNIEINELKKEKKALIKKYDIDTWRRHYIYDAS